MKNHMLCKVAWYLLLIGGLNWGLIGIGDFLNQDLNVVNMLLGTWPVVESIVYVLVGVSAVIKLFKCCKSC